MELDSNYFAILVLDSYYFPLMGLDSIYFPFFRLVSNNLSSFGTGFQLFDLFGSVF